MHLILGSLFDLATDLRLELSVEPDPPQAGTEICWIFEIANESASPRQFLFQSAQLADVVLALDGVEMHRWSSGRQFAQMVQEEALLPAERWRFVLEDVLPNTPARYAVSAQVLCVPALPVVHGEVSIISRG